MMFVRVVACLVLFHESTTVLTHYNDGTAFRRVIRSLESPITVPEDEIETERRRGLAEFIGNKIAWARLTEQERCVLNNLPPDAVLVAQGDFDDVAILLNLSSIPFRTVNRKRLGRSVLRPCRTLFINSGSTLLQPIASKPSLIRRTERRLKKFVLSGGVLVTTDSAISLLARNTSAFPLSCWNLRVKESITASARSVSMSKANELRSNNQSRRRRGRCSSHPDLTKLYSEVAFFLQSLTFGSSPRWNLRPVSPLVRIRGGRCSAAARKGLQKVYRSDDLPRRFDNLLFCGDMKRGSYFHVVGPISQTFPEGGTEVTDFFMHILMEKLTMNHTTKEERSQIYNMTRLLREAGSPLSVESITTAALAHDLVYRTILKAWLPECAQQEHVRRCTERTPRPSPVPDAQTPTHANNHNTASRTPPPVTDPFRVVNRDSHKAFFGS